jgi:hypothetical protein
MKRILIFLLLLACALCAAAQGYGQPLPQTVVTLTVSSPVSLSGALVTLTATVSGTPISANPSSTTPTGAIIFEDATTPLGQVALTDNLGLASATFFTADLASGSHQIVAQYSGDANFKAASSTAVTIAIESVSVTPAVTSLSLTQGQSGNIVYTVADAASVTTAVQFGCNAPANTYTTCAFNPAKVSGNGQTTFTITTTGLSPSSVHRTDFFTHGGAALACLLLGCLPFGSRFRRRVLGAARSSALMLAVLAATVLTGTVLALTGCSSSAIPKSPFAGTPTPPGTQVFEVITAVTANSQTISQDTWINVNILPAS